MLSYQRNYLTKININYMINKKNPPEERISPPQLKTAVKEINDYFDSLKKIYVGRDLIIDLVKYAMLQKSNLLFFGVPGTAKTAIADSIFQGITSSTNFEIQMTAFMADDALFGPYNIKKMRDEGIMEHNVENMLPTATFTMLDEFLDANPSVQRTLLSALNERRIIKGRQVFDLPLQLAYCATNVDPYLFLKRNPQAWAVFDRIGFIGRIDYLEKSEDISEMVKRFQYRTSKIPKGTIDLSVINSACDYIMLPPTLIQDQIIFIKYGEAIIEYRKKRREKMKEFEAEAADTVNGSFEVDYRGMIFHEISDRRVCWASYMFEVNAILSGRILVIQEDMIAAHYVLGTSDIEKDIWTEIINRKVEEINDLKQNELSDLQSQQIQHCRDQFEEIRGNGHDLLTRVNGVKTLWQQLNLIIPENDTVTKMFDPLKGDVNKYREQVGKELLEENGLKDGAK